MQLYKTYEEIETLWSDLSDKIDDPLFDQEELINHFEDEISKVEDERDRKATNIACLIKNFKAEADAYKQEAQRLQQRQRMSEKAIERLKGYLQSYLPVGTKINDTRASIGWRKSKVVEVTKSPDKLPDRYRRVKYAVDKTAIKEDIEGGEELPFARIIDKQNIQIK